MLVTPDVMASTNVALGFDYGTRRIGVAVGNGVTGNARALQAIATTDWAVLSELIDHWRPDALVVGLPLAADGSDQAITDQARNFMDDLTAHFGLPVHAVDERYSTIEAAERLRAARANGRKAKRVAKGDTDAFAAQVILESWFNHAEPI